MQLELTGAGPGKTYELRPRQVFGVGRNYRAHASELGNEVPTEPLIFSIAAGAMVATGHDIWRPAEFERVDFEGELGVVIGRPAQGVKADQALSHVLGYTCVNDVTIRDLQRREKQWTRGKGFDTACPVGPRIVAGLDPSNLAIETRLNGAVVQSARTSKMIFSVAEIIEYISEYVTLREGDLIATGTPAGVGNLTPGDSVTVTIEGIGTLENTVTAERPK